MARHRPIADPRCSTISQDRMTDLTYHFGHCELRTGTRELLVHGQVQALEPLAFDLLAHLLRHRDRDVSKNELLDEVWLGRIVSIGAVARAAMMARKAIACIATSPQIRTIHRVGYRFVGEVRETASSVPDKFSATGPVSVALLPFENLTGDLSLDWATIGLMALVGNALAIDTRLAPLSVHDVAAAMQGLGPEASVEARVDALRQRTGARYVVHTRILREEQGYRLDYRLLVAAGEADGTVYSGDLIRLGRALSRHLLRNLLPGAADGTDIFMLHDPWAMQLLARAMQASTEKLWTRALRMLRVVLDLEPDYDEARRELSRVEALATLLEDARAGGRALGLPASPTM
jgi:DNA-binding winged helix-turn-helix (wHTH) protein